MDQETLIQYISYTFTGIEVQRPSDGPGAGDTFVFYDPQHDTDPSRRLPFTTIVTKDYHGFDESSNLDRPGVFRLNIGVSRETFQALFGHLPTEESTESYDFAVLDRLMPHPAYGRQSWVCILNPTPETFETVKPLLAEAYSLVASRYAKSHARLTEQNLAPSEPGNTALPHSTASGLFGWAGVPAHPLHLCNLQAG